MYLRITGSLLRVGRSPGLPQLPAGMPVQGHHHLAFPADHHDQPVAIDQRRAGEAVQRDFSMVIADEILLLHDPARGRVETPQVAHRAKGIHPIAADGRRGARP
ncbi:MAG: hypothetical protein NTY19_37475 [Planctomycetota bacterium]|nr:hypothetical protein [Planctomycetota bacterium]